MRKLRRGVRALWWVGLLLLLMVIFLGGVLWTSMQSRSDLISIGQIAPDFTALTNEGRTVQLSQMRGQKRVVLVFYPGDNTSVCTTQLCAFRDNWSALQAQNAVVFGINPASQEKHNRFATKNRFPFPLLVDTGGDIAKRYGCLALFGIVKRTVYVLDQSGKVIWVKRGNPSPSEIIQALQSNSTAP